MKGSTHRFLSLLLLIAMLFSLGTSALVYAEDEEDGYLQSDSDDEDSLYVTINASNVDLKVGESTSISAIVTGAGRLADYEWTSYDESVATVRGSGANATIVAVGPGSTQVELNVYRSDINDFSDDFVVVTVEGQSTPVSVNGGGDFSLKAGESKNISATVSGGSGSYTYDWDSYGSVELGDHMRGNATVMAVSGGEGGVTLTVTDPDDPSNMDVAFWSFSVAAQSNPPEVELSRGGITMGPGTTASLSMSASGGSGSYEYHWSSDNESVATVSGSGSTVTITSASSVVATANTAWIQGFVIDQSTGLRSAPVHCVVTVEGGEASHDASGFATVGTNMNMVSITNSISSAYRQQVGSELGYGANVRFDSPSSREGALTLQDGTKVRSGQNYVFAIFQDMLFAPSANGTFSTGYTITESGNTISGTISIYVSGASKLTGVSLTPSNLRMTTYSSEFLTLDVRPYGANYTVRWSSSNSSVASVDGSGSTVVVYSGGITGKTVITATVTDGAGAVLTASTNVNVSVESSTAVSRSYNPTLTVVMGSDYYGTETSNNMSYQFRSYFGYSLGDDALITFNSNPHNSYGRMRLSSGGDAVAYRSYTFREWIGMYFEPLAAGTYNLPYEINYRGYTMSGTLSIYIKSANISASLSSTNMRLSTYSSQYLSVTVTPSRTYYRVSWSSSNTNIATVSGSGDQVLVSSGGVAGTATITVSVYDNNGVEVRRSCSVTVADSGESTYNPSVATTLGTPYTGIGTSSAMRNQFKKIYNMDLDDANATIRFSSTGNNGIGILRLENGSNALPNTSYSFAQYIKMYTQPISSGTYSFPYTLSYNGKSLSGTVSVVISSATINVALGISGNSTYQFNQNASIGTTGASLFSSAISNAVGTGWSYLRFSSSTDSTGTLYLNSNRAAITTGTNVNASSLSNLYFATGTVTTDFSAAFTVYTANDAVVGSGILTINKGASFTDVAVGAYYASAVNWAVSRGVTTGTTATTFGPDTTVERCQAVTFLWRAAGEPKPSSSYNPFADVAADSYYYNAVLWAVEKGITAGISATEFAPRNPLERDQLLTFLCRAAGANASGDNWSELAVNWATGRGLMTGIPGTFSAKEACPRRDVVYYLWKYYN